MYRVVIAGTPFHDEMYFLFAEMNQQPVEKRIKACIRKFISPGRMSDKKKTLSKISSKSVSDKDGKDIAATRGKSIKINKRPPLTGCLTRKEASAAGISIKRHK